MSCNSRTLTTAQIRQLVIHDREELCEEDLLATLQRPMTRGECVYGVRPCPWVGCKHNLFLDVKDTGSIILNYPDLEGPEDMDPEQSCVLDVIERNPDGMILDGIAKAMGSMTRERVRQIETIALSFLNDTIPEDEMERTCACGCGERFTPTSNRQLFANKSHATKTRQTAWRAKKKNDSSKSPIATLKESAAMANTRSKAAYEKLLIEQVDENKRLNEKIKALSEHNNLLYEQLEKAKEQAETAKMNDQDAARARGLKAEVERLEEVVAVKDKRISALEQRLTETSLITQTVQVSEPQLLSAIVAPLGPDTITATQMKAVLHEALEIAKMIREAA